MGNKLQIFEAPDFGQIRVTIADGKPWFAAPDIARSLEYDNPEQAVRDYVNRTDKTVAFHLLGYGAESDLLYINQNGLYGLMLSSRSHNAHKLKTWIAKEVLPCALRNNKSDF